MELDDGKRKFYIRNPRVIKLLIQRAILIPSQGRFVAPRRANHIPTMVLKDGDMGYTIEFESHPMGSGGWITCPREIVQKFYRLYREVEKEVETKMEYREPEKPVLLKSVFDFFESTVFDFYQAIDELGTTKGFGNIGIILTGPPGVGKTETMRWLREKINSEYDRSYHNLSLSQLNKMLIEGHQLNVNDSVIFIDDIDANILRDRQETRNPLTSQFLTCLDGLDKCEGRVIVVSTNEKVDKIDPALTRAGRFEHILHYDYPSLELIGQFLARREANLDPGMFEDWSFARIDMFLARYRVAAHRYGTTLPVFYEKFIHTMGERDPTVEAYRQREEGYVSQ